MGRKARVGVLENGQGETEKRRELERKSGGYEEERSEVVSSVFSLCPDSLVYSLEESFDSCLRFRERKIK